MERGDDPMDRRAADEADAAAAEAAEVGGRADDERDPVEEAGGGEAEGFEQAEELLREHAEHGEPAPDPSAEALKPEAESDRETGGSRGEPDEAKSSERSGDV